MFFETCCEMPNVGLLVFVYGVANFLALVGETTYSLATIADMRGADTMPEYLRAGINGTVRVITMSMCAWWILSANKAQTKGMKVAFAWILLRSVGNVLYAYGNVLYETVIMPENLMNFLGLSSTFSHTTRVISATSWLLAEAFVLSRMHAFHCLATAPDHWQQTDEPKPVSATASAKEVAEK
ncbi:uncharacterized protein LOC144118373 [Amblyomma americanum]